MLQKQQDKEDEKESVNTEQEKETAKMKKVKWKDKNGNNGTGWMGFQGLQQCEETHCENHGHCKQKAEVHNDFNEATSIISDAGSTFNSASNEERLAAVGDSGKAVQMNANARSRIAKVQQDECLAWKMKCGVMAN